jgi:hypothetical protein
MRAALLRLLTAAFGTFETSTDVRYTAAFRGKLDIERTSQNGRLCPTETLAAQDFRSAKSLLVFPLKRVIVPSIA